MTSMPPTRPLTNEEFVTLANHAPVLLVTAGELPHLSPFVSLTEVDRDHLRIESADMANPGASYAVIVRKPTTPEAAADIFDEAHHVLQRRALATFN